jgi:DNA-binding MarR family transcriptional regulator
LIARTRDVRDRRAYQVELTDAGRSILATVWARQVAELQSTVSGFDDAALATTAEVLRRIAARARQQCALRTPPLATND